MNPSYIKYFSMNMCPFMLCMLILECFIHFSRARMSSKYSLLRGNGQLAYAHWGDVSDNGSPNVSSLAENCSSSDDVGVFFISVFAKN